MWSQSIERLTDTQFEAIFQYCIDRCMSGNSWPPELSDVVVAVTSMAVDDNPFGISFDVMLTDWKRYCRDRGMYDSAEMYPFKHPVQYWMFTDLRAQMLEHRLTDIECERRLAKMLAKWTERVHKGETVPRPTLKVEDKTRPPPAWMELLEKSKQRTQ